MSETFDKLLENRDYWRDEAKASWANIEAIEVGNSRLEEEVAELRQEIHRLQQKADELMDSYAERTYQLIEAQRELELNETQEVATFNQRFFDPSTLNNPLNVELEWIASREVFDLIKGKPPEQELREITMVAKFVDDKPAHEAARPPRRTRRRVRRYRRWPR